jgi:hypothetical protein
MQGGVRVQAERNDAATFSAVTPADGLCGSGSARHAQADGQMTVR